LDPFEVRGMERAERGQLQEPRVSKNTVALSHRGLDGVVRTTTLRFSPQPADLTSGGAEFAFDLASKESVDIGVEIVPQVGPDAPPRRSLEDMRGGLERDYSRWRKQCTRFRTSNLQLSRFLERAVL